MKKFLSFLFLISLFFSLVEPVAAATSLVTIKPGRFYIQTESYGRAWYVSPRDQTRYYLRTTDGMRALGPLALGISNRDLRNIPTETGGQATTKLSQRLAGYFLLATENQGQLWYVNPVTFRRRLIDKSEALLRLLQQSGQPVKDRELATIPMNSRQLMFDPTFKYPTYARLDNGQVVAEGYGNVIRPLASLSKLMTALVFLDHDPDWERTVLITADQVKYPSQLVGDDATSEVDLKAGDQVKLKDLWVAMLVASSNQAAVILADSTGLSRTDFVAEMNLKAQELGLSKTLFYDMAGLDSHNVSTAIEMAKLAAAAFNQPLIKEASQKINYSFVVIDSLGLSRTVIVLDRNYSLRAFGPDAAKTGFLVEAQRNATVLKNVSVIVILNAQSMSQRNDILRKLWPEN